MLRIFNRFISWVDYKIKVFTYWFLIYRKCKCKCCVDGELYPHYGIAPHIHNMTKPGQFIGSTEMLPRDK